MKSSHYLARRQGIIQCMVLHEPLQRQNAVSAYFTSKQILHFDFARHLLVIKIDADNGSLAHNRGNVMRQMVQHRTYNHYYDISHISNI